VASIIEQIQQDALDRSVPVSDLLRRVKLAATKLGLGAVEDWVEKELNGYPELPVPDYRVISGTPVANNQFRGWEPIGGQIEKIRRRDVLQSVASLEGLINAPDHGVIHFPYNDALVKKLNDMNHSVGKLAALQVDRSTIVGILDRVRNLVLDWSLKMEQAGVLGTEFNFSTADKAKAQGATTTINIGTIGSFAGNLGSGNTSGDAMVGGLNIELVADLALQLRAHLDQLEHSGANIQTLEAKLDLIAAEIAKDAPSNSMLRGLLVDVRNAIAGAAGNLMATGATAPINQILSTGVPNP